MRYFVAVAEELHFGRAARRLHISQPALSHQIRKLEADLDVRLLERTSRRVALTPAGSAFLADAYRVLAAAAAAQRTARSFTGAAVEQLAIGFTGSAASDLLPPVLSRFRADWPNVALSLRELTTARYDLLRSGELDLVFGRLRLQEMPDLHVEVLREEPRLVALRSDHPLADRPDLPLAALRDEAFITQPEHVNAAFRRDWLAEQRRHGLPGRIAAEATSIQEFLSFVALGRGVCLVPATAERFHPRPGIAYVPIADIAPTTTSLAWRDPFTKRSQRGLIDIAVAYASTPGQGAATD